MVASSSNNQSQQQQRQADQHTHEEPPPPPQALRQLSTKAARHRFVIPPAEVQQLLQAAGCSMDTLLLSFLDEAAHDARPPISNYKVG